MLSGTVRLFRVRGIPVQVIERLGLAGDAPLPIRLIEHIAEDLSDEDGPLVRLPGDRLAQATRLTSTQEPSSPSVSRATARSSSKPSPRHH